MPTRIPGSTELVRAAREAARLTAWKAPVMTVASAAISPSGLSTVNGYALQEGDGILRTEDGVGNGLWVASANHWKRREDAADGSHLPRGTRVAVAAGDLAGAVYFLEDGPPIVGVGSQSWIWEASRTRVTTAESGDTLQPDYLHILYDVEQVSPSFVLPEPSTWTGRRILVKRLDQAAASVTFTVDGGANIDGLSSHTLVGSDVAAEFWSDGVEVYVGPTSSLVTAPASELPPAVAGRYHLFDPSVPGTITLSGTAIVSATDALGGGGVFTSPSAPRRLERRMDTTLNGRPHARMTRAANSTLTSSTGGPTGDAPRMVVCLVRFNDTTTVTGDLHPVASFATGQDFGVFHGMQGGLPNCIFSGRNVHPLPRSLGWGGAALDGRVTWQPVAGVWYVLAVRYDPATQRKELWIDGEIYASYTQTSPQATTQEYGLGGLSSTAADADVGMALWCNQRPSDSEMQALHAWIAERWGVWRPALYVTCGDSLSQGQRPTPYGLTPWPPMPITEGLFPGADVEQVNLSVSGYEPGDYETQIPLPAPSTGTVSRLTAGALWRASGMRRAGPGLPGLVAIVWVASNGPATGETGAAEWTRTQTLLSQLRNAGFITIVATGIWRTDQNAQHVALDALIRAGSASWNYLVDLDQIVEFQSNTASYTENDGLGAASDGVHLRQGAVDGNGLRVREAGNGYGKIAWHFAQAIRQALGL